LVTYVNGVSAQERCARARVMCVCVYVRVCVCVYEYRVPVSLDWNGMSIKETVYWFEGEDDASLNSNVFDVAQNVVNKHFPGTSIFCTSFTERLVCAIYGDACE
jgi:hypothetical protein